MTIASEIQRIQTNIANAYDAAEAKGATMPVIENSDNLATTIESIAGEVDTSKIYTLSMASEVLNDVLTGQSSDLYKGAEEAIDIIGEPDSITKLPNDWQYAVDNIETHYQEILTNDHLVTLNTLTNIIGE